MSMSTKPDGRKVKILATGFEVHFDIPQSFRDLYGTPDEVQAKIDADEQNIRDAGYDVTVYFIDDKKTQEGLKWLEDKLRSDKFDGIVIGAGLRLIPPQTVFFEQVMNMVRRASPGSVLMFNNGPGGSFEAIKRNADLLLLEEH